MRDRKILVTGPTGQVASPVARALARENEVWGIARFRDEAARASLEADGVRCEAVDLAVGDFSALPDDFDVVLHFAVARSPDGSFERDLRANAESAGLLMSHCRRARAFFHCSSCAVYQPKGHEPLTEDDPLGDNHRVMMPTYSLSKIAAESTVRFAAREFGLPTLVARLNMPYGANGGWPAYHLLMMQKGIEIPVHVNAPSVYTPIHEDDILATLPALVGAASVPAKTVNWCGQEHVSIEEWCGYLGELTGLSPVFRPTDRTLESVVADNARMRGIAGPARVSWKDGFRRMLASRAPELLRS